MLRVVLSQHAGRFSLHARPKRRAGSRPLRCGLLRLRTAARRRRRRRGRALQAGRARRRPPLPSGGGARRARCAGGAPAARGSSVGLRSMPARIDRIRLVTKNTAARIAGGAGQHVGGAAARHEAAAAAAADAEPAAFGRLQQHDADHGEHHHQVDDDDDGLHQANPFNLAGRAHGPAASCASYRKFAAVSTRSLAAISTPARRACALSDKPPAIARKSSAFRLAPPTSAPSTSATRQQFRGVDGLTEPP